MTSSGNTREQERLQAASLADQNRMTDANIAFLERQQAALRKAQVSPYRAGSPAPTMATAGSDYAAAREKIDANRRFGFNRTVRGGMRGGSAYAA